MCKNVCVRRQQQIQKRALLTTQYSWHTDKTLEAIRLDNIQETAEACSDPLASPLWFDKIVLATTSRRLGLQTVTYCPRNHCGKRVREINSFLIIHLAQFIYSSTSYPSRKRG